MKSICDKFLFKFTQLTLQRKSNFSNRIVEIIVQDLKELLLLKLKYISLKLHAN